MSNVKSKRVCSVHFEERAYSCPQDISSSRLLPSAVPTLISCPNPPKTIASKRAPPKERPALLSRKRSRNDDGEMLAALNQDNTEPPPSKKVKVDKSLETLLSEAQAALKKCRAQNKKLYRQNTNLRKMNTKLHVRQRVLYTCLDKSQHLRDNILADLPPAPAALIKVLLSKKKSTGHCKKEQWICVFRSFLGVHQHILCSDHLAFCCHIQPHYTGGIVMYIQPHTTTLHRRYSNVYTATYNHTTQAV